MRRSIPGARHQVCSLQSGTSAKFLYSPVLQLPVIFAKLQGAEKPVGAYRTLERQDAVKSVK